MRDLPIDETVVMAGRMASHPRMGSGLLLIWLSLHYLLYCVSFLEGENVSISKVYKSVSCSGNSVRNLNSCGLYNRLDDRLFGPAP